MEEELELTMYIIQKWLLVRDEDDQSGLASVKFIVVLERRIMSELLGTYLPTFLLLGITFCTTFFKAEYFEAALTVNLTNMLVLTTIFISVMQTLPKTAYVKHIDLWLIFCQMIPFIEVILITAAETLREPDENGMIPFNHHGTTRMIRVSPDPDTKPHTPDPEYDPMSKAQKGRTGRSTRDWIKYAGTYIARLSASQIRS